MAFRIYSISAWQRTRFLRICPSCQHQNRVTVFRKASYEDRCTDVTIPTLIFTCIQKALSSNLRRDIAYPDRFWMFSVFLGFSVDVSKYQCKLRRNHHHLRFTIHYHPPAFDAVAGPELLTSSLNKPHTTIPTVCHPPTHLPIPPTFYLSTYKSTHPTHYYSHPNLPVHPPYQPAFFIVETSWAFDTQMAQTIPRSTYGMYVHKSRPLDQTDAIFTDFTDLKISGEDKLRNSSLCPFTLLSSTMEKDNWIHSLSASNTNIVWHNLSTLNTRRPTIWFHTTFLLQTICNSHYITDTKKWKHMLFLLTLQKKYFTGLRLLSAGKEVEPSLSTTWRQIRGAQVYLRSFLTWTLDGGQWLTSRPDSFTPGKNLCTYWTEGWVGLKVCLGVLEKGKISWPQLN